jgi:hypothetical protein
MPQSFLLVGLKAKAAQFILGQLGEIGYRLNNGDFVQLQKKGIEFQVDKPLLRVAPA